MKDCGSAGASKPMEKVKTMPSVDMFQALAALDNSPPTSATTPETKKSLGTPTSSTTEAFQLNNYVA